jgi:hypothetical protein
MSEMSDASVLKNIHDKMEKYLEVKRGFTIYARSDILTAQATKNSLLESGTIQSSRNSTFCTIIQLLSIQISTYFYISPGK